MLIVMPGEPYDQTETRIQQSSAQINIPVTTREDFNSHPKPVSNYAARRQKLIGVNSLLRAITR
jgi:hypothetical protein